MRMVNRNLPRAFCASILALAIHTMAPTAEGAGDVAHIASDSPAVNAIWNSGKARWEANMLSFGRTHCKTLVNKGPGDLLSMTYYDAIEVYLQIWQYTKDPSWKACAEAAAAVYRDTYVLRSDLMGSVPGYWNFTNGLVMDYQLNGDQRSKTAAILLSQKAAFAADYTPLGWTSDASLSREVAYSIRAYLNAEKLGEPRRARLADLVKQQLGIIDQWFISKTYRISASAAAGIGIPAGAYYIQPFMVGLSMEALIMYYEATNDPKVVPAIKICLDWLWANAWVPADNAFWYDNWVTDPKLPFPAKKGAPDLNLLIAPAYAWFYQITGDKTYRDRGDLVFAGGSRAFLHGVKQFNQNYSYGFQYVSRRLLAEAGSPPLASPSTVDPGSNAPPAPQDLSSSPWTPQAQLPSVPTQVVPSAPAVSPAAPGGKTH